MFVYNFGHYRQFLSIDCEFMLVYRIAVLVQPGQADTVRSVASYFYLIDAMVRAPVSVCRPCSAAQH